MSAADLHPNARRVVDAAAVAGLTITVVEYPEGTRTAAEAAEAVGCQVDQIVKSLVFDGDGQVVLALTSGANRVDTTALARLLGLQRLGRADADRVRAATGFPIGGVAPFVPTGADGVLVVMDEDLLVHEQVWAAAGTPRHVFAIAPGELRVATGAQVAAFAQPS